MRPLRPRDRLDRRLASGRLRARHLRAVARALGALHRGAKVRAEVAPAAPLALAQRLLEYQAAVASRRYPPGLELDVARLETAQRRFLADAVDVLLERAGAGRVRRIHGRIGCRHVWVGRKGTVHLAAGRSEAWGDVAEDVAALAIDLRGRGASRQAELFVAAYAHAADDYGLYDVFDGYERDAGLHFALEASRSRGREPEPGAYLHAALAGERLPPLVVATAGLIASGKSTLAKLVARRLAAPLVVADRVQAALLTPLPIEVAHEVAWDPDFATRVYRDVFWRAAAVLRSGRSVVLDACFADSERRREAADLAERHGAALVFLECQSPPADVEARLRHRDLRDGGPPGGWRALARSNRDAWRPLGPDEPGRQIRVDTGRSRRHRVHALERLCAGRP